VRLYRGTRHGIGGIGGKQIVVFELKRTTSKRRAIMDKLQKGTAATTWRVIQWLETHHADLAARLGCYVLIVVDKR